MANWSGVMNIYCMQMSLVMDMRFISAMIEMTCHVTGLPASPVINSVFGRLCRKTASRGREDTRVWYRETMFSQTVSYDFLLHGLLHEYFLYLVSAPPPLENPEGVANLKKAICVVRSDSIIA